MDYLGGIINDIGTYGRQGYDAFTGIQAAKNRYEAEKRGNQPAPTTAAGLPKEYIYIGAAVLVILLVMR